MTCSNICKCHLLRVLGYDVLEIRDMNTFLIQFESWILRWGFEDFKMIYATMLWSLCCWTSSRNRRILLPWTCTSAIINHWTCTILTNQIADVLQKHIPVYIIFSLESGFTRWGKVPLSEGMLGRRNQGICAFASEYLQVQTTWLLETYCSKGT